MTRPFLPSGFAAGCLAAGVACGQSTELDPCDISPVQACFCPDGNPGARACTGGACDCSVAPEDPCAPLPIRYARVRRTNPLGSPRLVGMAVRGADGSEAFVEDARFLDTLADYDEASCPVGAGVRLSTGTGTTSAVFELPREAQLGDELLVYGCRNDPPPGFGGVANPSVGFGGALQHYGVEVAAYPGGPWYDAGSGRGLAAFPVSESVVPRLCDPRSAGSIEDARPDDGFSERLDLITPGEGCRPYSFVRVRSLTDEAALFGVSYFGPNLERTQPAQVVDYEPATTAGDRRDPSFALQAAASRTRCDEPNAVDLGSFGTVTVDVGAVMDNGGRVQTSGVPGCGDPTREIAFSVAVARALDGPFRTVGRTDGSVDAVILSDLDDGCGAVLFPSLRRPEVDLRVPTAARVDLRLPLFADASGEGPLAYIWELLERPMGSNDELLVTDATPSQASLRPTVAGRFTVRVTVTDADGRRSASQKTFVAAPSSCGDPIEVAAPIAEPTTWSPATPSSCTAYRVTSSIGVQAPLIIEAGTRIELARNVAISVVDGGYLRALGEPGAAVAFVGEVRESRYWEALVFRSNDDRNLLRNSLVVDGGSGSDLGATGRTPSGVLVWRGGRLSIEDSSIVDNGLYPVTVRPGGLLDGFSNNTLRGEVGSLHLPISQVGALDVGTRYQNDHVLVQGDAPEPGEWPPIAAAIRLDGNFVIDFADERDVLRVLPGARIELATDSAVTVQTGGLDISGTAAEPIDIAGVNPTQKGSWESIVFASQHPDNRLHWATVANGGAGRELFVSNRTPAQVLVWGAASIEDTTFDVGSRYAVQTSREAELRSFARNTFRGHDDSVVRVYAGQLDALASSNDFDGGGNAFPEVVVFADTLTRSATWARLNVPVVMTGLTSLQRTGVELVIEPGAQLLFDRNAGLGIELGQLRAIGTAAEPIRFEGLSPSVGFWEAIVVRSAEVGNEIAFAEIRHGGSGTELFFSNRIPAPVIVDDAGRLLLRDSVIEDSQLCFSGGERLETRNLTTGGCQ